MKSVEHYKEIFERNGGKMRSMQLQNEGILYRPLQKLIEQGFVEKVRYGSGLITTTLVRSAP